MKKKIIWVLVALLAAGGAWFFYNKSIIRVEVVKAQRAAIAETIEETGYTRASESYQLQAPSNGKVLAIQVANGQQVKANEVIMQLEDLTLEADLAEVNQNAAEGEAAVSEAQVSLKSAYVDLEDARSNYEKNKALYESGGLSRADYDAAVSSLKKSEQAVELLKSRIENGNKQLSAYYKEQNSLQQKYDELAVRSPIDGYILDLPAKKDQLVGLGTTLAVIGTPNRLEAYVEILSSEVVQIKPGQKAAISFGGEDEAISGRVKEIYPQAQEKLSALNVLERRVPVVVTLDRNGPLQPGYEVKVKIDCATRDKALVVPREALISGSGGESRLRIVENGRVVIKEVKTGLKNGLQAEITSGLKPGDLVIRDGSLSLDENSRVKAIE